MGDKRIRGLFVDFGNVIGHFDTLRMFSFVEENRGNKRDPKELFSGPLKEAMNLFDKNAIDAKTYFNTIRDYYDLQNITMEDYFKMNLDILSIDQEMIEIIRSLRSRGIVTALITNMNICHLRFLLQQHPYLFTIFNYYMVSCVEGVIKPEPEAWIRSLDYIGLPAERCLFVDDHYPNIEAASDLRVKTFHYNVTDENFCPNGKLDQERERFKNHLENLDASGLLFKKAHR